MDMSQYLDVFLEESSENLQTLNQNILELEKEPENKDIINSIFRVAHTLKGMAGSMGFTDIAELTHKMENVLDKFRNDVLKVDSKIINVLFKCLDTLEIMINNIRDGSDEKIDIYNLIRELEGVGENSKEQFIEDNKIDFTLNIYDENIIKQAKEKDYNVFVAEVILADDCLLKSARSFLVYKTIEDLGEIIKTIPSVDDLEQENFQDRFYIMFLTQKSIDEVKDLILNISEIKEVNINSVNEYENVKTDKETKEQPINKIVTNDKEVSNFKKQESVNAKTTKEEEKNKKAHQSVRVDLERLDKFMNLVGELVIHRTRLEQISTNYRLGELHETLEQVGRITSDLQDLVMKVRMLPIERVFNRFPRMIRDLSQELGKDIELIIKGEDTELDRTVIDEIGEPLVHLIRNAADHGIERTEERINLGKPAKGTIKLVAYQEGNKAVIKIEDDGKGLDIEKIKKKAESIGINTDGMSENDIKNLIFMQGFSTSEKVTDISGRGVGMDVVKTKIANLGGTVEVLSEKGKGTAFIIRLPLTLSIIQALLVKVAGETFAISLGFIDRVINININEIKSTNNKEVILYRDKIIPIIRLSDKLNLKSVDSNNKYIVIVKTGEKTVGLLVDELMGQQEIVIKPIGKLLQNLREYVGATILGDGLVTLILDVAAIV